MIETIFEHDVPYSSRVCIDKNIRVGYWYNISVRQKNLISIRHREDLLEKPDFIICAYDIETTKAPMKFPDADID